MKINEILKEFVDECSKKLDLKCILQFGSSTYSDDAHDIDLTFFFNGGALSDEQMLLLMEIIKEFEDKYSDIVFDFGGVATRDKKGDYFITIVLFGNAELNIKHIPADIFFFKSLKEDKDKKILFGKDPLKNFNLELTNEQLFEMLSLELKRSLRLSLDSNEKTFETTLFLFKTFLRVMLINEKSQLKKGELLENFDEVYGEKIKLPSDSERILGGELNKEDFKNILKFCTNCLNYLIK